MNWILWILGLVGHIGIWATVFNQIHATACPRSSRKISEKVILVIVFLPIPLALASLLPLDQFFHEPISFKIPFRAPQPYFELQTMLRDICSLHQLGFYGYLCITLGSFFAARWLFRRLTTLVPTAVLRDIGHIRNLGKELKAESLRSSKSNSKLLHGWFAKLLGRIPFNQVLLAEVKQLELQLNVPVEVDGFRICQLSDLHFTGHIDKRYFQAVVEIANDFQPHLTLITGDLLDKDCCIPWVEETVGRLRAELGCYFVLGNHDLLVKDQTKYLAELARCGLKRISEWTSINFQQSVIRLAGNELPWYPGADELCELSEKRDSEFRLLLTHSPDQIRWAQRYGFDLILAGHNHGGQIRFPVIGAVIVPSRYGVKYASGTFQVGESIMHVSRGISGDEPIRINCPPEIGLITIRSSRKQSEARENSPGK